jgi:hypothetical protein
MRFPSSSYWPEPIDEGLTWRPDYTRRFLVRDTRTSDHPAVTGLEKSITIDDLDSRKIWVFSGDILLVPRTDDYARMRIASGDRAEIYDYASERAMFRERRQ